MHERMNERILRMMRYAVIAAGPAYLTLPLGLWGAWVAASAALIAAVALALLLVDRHRDYREPISRWLGLPPALACTSAAALLEPMLGYHPYYDPPVAQALPGLVGLVAAAWSLLPTFSARRVAGVLAVALVLGGIAIGTAPRGGREPWGAVAAMPVVLEFDASDAALVPLPDGLAFAGERLTTSRRRATDLPGVVLDTGIHGLTLCRPAAQRQGVIPCSKRPLAEYLGAGGRLQVRELPDVWLVTHRLDTDRHRHPEYSGSHAFSKATLDPVPLHPWDLGVRLAAPARWSHVAAGGLVLSLLAAVYCLLRAARHRWMLRASAGTHLGEGVIALDDATAHADATAPLGDVAVVVTGEPPAAYRENATLARLLPGTPAQVRDRWLDGLAGDLAACGLVALIAATPVLVAVLLGHSLLW